MADHKSKGAKSSTVSAVRVMQNAVYLLDGVKNTAKTPQSKPKVDTPKSISAEKGKTIRIAPWGKNNDRPQKVMKQADECGILKGGLKKLRKMHFGNGLILMRRFFDEGKYKDQPVDINDAQYAAIKEFTTKNNLKKYLRESICDYENFSWIATELIFSDDSTRVNFVNHLDTPFCRLTVADPQTKKSEYLIFSADFGSSNTVTVSGKDSNGVKIPLINDQMSVDEIKKLIKGLPKTQRKAVYVSAMPDAGHDYYTEPDWWTVIDNGWVDIVREIPKIKKAIFKNQMTLKYQVKIHTNYWKALYDDNDDRAKNWETMTFDERQKAMQEELQRIDDSLSDSENAGKTIHTAKTDDGQGGDLDYIEINPIDDKLKDGKYIPDAQGGNAEILFALGLDPSIPGHGFPGGKLGAGSGSDKREAYEMHVMMSKMDRDITLEPFEFIAKYNEWPDDVRLKYEQRKLVTLDKNPTGSENTA